LFVYATDGLIEPVRSLGKAHRINLREGNLMLTTARRSAVVLAAATTLAAPALLVASAADAAAAVLCRAHVSDSTPKKYTDVYVHVRLEHTRGCARWPTTRQPTPFATHEPIATAAPRSPRG